MLVAGGKTTLQADSALKTVELWDPATGAWSELPPMAHDRFGAGCCVLPSGRVAVVGGLKLTDNGVQLGGVWSLERKLENAYTQGFSTVVIPADAADEYYTTSTSALGLSGTPKKTLSFT